MGKRYNMKLIIDERDEITTRVKRDITKEREVETKKVILGRGGDYRKDEVVISNHRRSRRECGIKRGPKTLRGRGNNEGRRARSLCGEVGPHGCGSGTCIGVRLCGTAISAEEFVF